MIWVIWLVSIGLILASSDLLSNRLSVVPFPIHLESSYQASQAFLGKTVGERVSDISFERGGLITTLRVNDGQVVNKNDIIATLDTSLLLERQKQLQAQKRGIIAQQKLSKKELRRLRQLRKDGHVSEQEFDRELTKLNNLTSRLDGINAQLASVALDLKKSTLYAPFNGSVLKRFVHEGVTVLPSQNIVRLQESTIDEVHIGVAQQFLPALEKGRCYPIIIEKKAYQGCIDQLLTQLSDKTQTVRVIFSLPKNHHALSGQIAKLHLTKTRQQEGMWVPLDALAQGMRGTWTLYQLLPDKSDQRVRIVTPVTIEVIYTYKNQAYISAPLKEGDQIIATGLHKYAPSQRVTVTHAPSKNTRGR